MSNVTRFPIVGIGASAGGIRALEGFLKGLAPEPGIAFVIVTHLSPDRVSLLHEVIDRYTTLPVIVAEDDMPVRANHIYVMPQNAILTIKDGVLQIRRPDPISRERKPIDIFFASLAEDQGEYSVGIILSGGDGDGTLGAKAIKEFGGLTIAQGGDGSGPSHPDMPQSAILSGMIDIELPVEDMGARLVAFARSFDLLEDATRSSSDQEQAELDQARQEICNILSSHSGHDFSGYKTKTFLRRVKRRMQVRQLRSMKDYVELLRQEAPEVTSLFRDLLINVTNFFRDADAFKFLEEQVVPKLFEGKAANDRVRIWVPGCATGEEVFSIAILIREYMEKLTAVPKVQIFATDIDEPALAVARAARYPETLLDGLSPERRRRFFKADGGSYTLNNEVRELCIFSPHSLIRDPPFSRMDMVSCRNLLIYFGPDIQQQVIPTFHYSLKPGGYLFLGSSESIGQHNHLFATIDKKLRVFQGREHPSKMPRLPSIMGQDRSNIFSDGTSGSARQNAQSLRQAVEGRILERHAPAHVVVNAEGDIVYYSAGTGRFLEPPQGAPSRQLLTVARRGLRLDIRAALRECVESQLPARRENLLVEREDTEAQVVGIIVEPITDRANAEPLYLVVFHAHGLQAAKADGATAARQVDSDGELERELRDTKERLQSTIEEYETALEELKSSNEELVSVNEEVQSSNEELEASKEETQSLNEELNTINSELNGKIEELDQANSDLRNLFDSTEIATIFLDRNLVIRSFTPAAASFFNLRPADVGRPLTELSSELDYPNLKDHIKDVFDSGTALEHQLAQDSRGKHYLVRLIPYRTNGDDIDGVVVTLVDVSRLAEAEQHKQVLIGELNHRVKNMLAVVKAIAKRTLETSASPDAFQTAFLGRLSAMSRAYGTLSQENWEHVSIREVISKELNPFGVENYTLTGPDIRLRPQHGLSLAMVIHELATNASKYGAFSKEDGKVNIEWKEESETLKLRWREIDGPPVNRPETNGFGLELLNGEIGYRMRGKIETNFATDGLIVAIEFPLRA